MGLFTQQLKIDISEIINPIPKDYKLVWAHEVKLQYTQKYVKLRMANPPKATKDNIGKFTDTAKITKEIKRIQTEGTAEELKLIDKLLDRKDELYRIEKDTNKLIDERTKKIDKEYQLLEDINDISKKINKEAERRIKYSEDIFKFEKVFSSGVDKRLAQMKNINGVQQEYVDILTEAGNYQKDSIHNWAKSLKLTKDLTETQKQISKLEAAINVAREKGNFAEADILKKQQQKLKLINAVEATGRTINKGLEISKKLWGDIKQIVSMVGNTAGLLVKPFKALDDALGNVLSNAIRLVMNPLALMGVMIGLAVARMEKFSQATVNISRQFGIQGEQLSKINNIATGLYESYRDMGVELEQMPEYINAAVEGMGNLDLVTRKNTEMILQMNKGWGVSTQSAGEFIGMMSKMTHQGEKGAQNMMNLAKAMSDAKGIPVNKVIEDIANASDTAYGFLSGMPDKMVRTAVEARRLGMNLESVSKMARGLLDVESSMGAEMEASIMTGKNLNFNAARRLALEGDLIGAQEEVMKQMGGIEEFNKMDILQKEAIAKATGLSVKELSKTLEQREEEARLADERKKREDKMNEAIDKGLNLFTKITSISEKWSHFFENIKKILAEAIMPYVKMTMEYLMGNMKTIENIVKNFITKLFMPLFKLTFDFGKQILELFGIKFQKGPGSILEKINKTILNWSDSLERKIKPKLQEILEKYIKPIAIWIKDTAIQIKNWLFNQGGWDKIKVTFEKIVDAAKALWDSLGKILEKLGIKSTGKGVAGVLDTVLNIVQKIADYIKENPFKSLFALSMLKFGGLRSLILMLTGLIAKGGLKSAFNLATGKGLFGGAGEKTPTPKGGGGLFKTLFGGSKTTQITETFTRPAAENLEMWKKLSVERNTAKQLIQEAKLTKNVEGLKFALQEKDQIEGAMKTLLTAEKNTTQVITKEAGMLSKAGGTLSKTLTAAGVITSAIMAGKDVYDIASGEHKSGVRNKETRESAIQLGTAGTLAGVGAAVGSVIPGLGTVAGGTLGYALGDMLGQFIAKNENVNKMLDAMDLEGGLEKMQNAAKTFGDNVSNIWNDETLSWGEKIGKIIKEVFVLMWESAKTQGEMLLKAITSAEFWTGLGGAIFDGLKTLLYDLPKWISTFLSDMVRGIFGYEKGGEIDKIMNKIFLVIINPFAAIIDVVTESWDTIKTVFKAGWDFIDKYFVQPIVKMYNIVKNVIETINNYIEGVFWYIYGAIIKPVVDLIQSAWQGIADFFSPYLDSIKNTFMSVWNAINENVISPITKGITVIGEKISGLWDSISNFFGNMKNGFMDWAKSIGNAIMELPGIKQVKWLWDKTSELLSGAEETTGNMKSSSESFKEAGMKYAGVNDALIRVNDTVIKTADKDQILATTDMQGMLKTVGDLAREDMVNLINEKSEEDKKFEQTNIGKAVVLNRKWFGTETNPYLKIIADVLSNYFDNEMISFKKTQIANAATSNMAKGGIINAASGLMIEQNAINRGVGGAVPGRDKPFYNANLGVYMHSGETVAKTASGGMAVLNRDQQQLLAMGGHPQFLNAAGGLSLNAEQISNAKTIAAASAQQGITNADQLAYVLGTAYHESGLRPIAEIGGPKKRYAPYYGRGFVQLTWKDNYAKYEKLTGKPLVSNPDILLGDVPTSAFIIAHGMKTGNFTGKKLDDYINSKGTDFVNARRIINILDKAEKIAGDAKAFRNAIDQFGGGSFNMKGSGGGNAAAGWLATLLPGWGGGSDSVTTKSSMQPTTAQTKTGTGTGTGTGTTTSNVDLTKLGSDVANPGSLGVTPANRPLMKFFYDRLDKAMKATGKNFDGWGSRSAADQRRLKAEKGKWAAAPGRSRHEWGLAIDVKPGYWRSQKDDTELLKYGLWRPLLNNASTPEPWHIEPIKDGGGRMPLEAGSAARKVLENMAAGGFIKLKYSSEPEGDAPPPEISKLIVKSPAKDFIVQGNAAAGTTVTPIASNDTIVGAQPGGVLATGNTEIAKKLDTLIAVVMKNTEAVRANSKVEVTKLSGVEG